MSQIIINLISNSLKFTKDGIVSLEVKLQKSESELDYIVFEVKDNGIGIPAALHEKVLINLCKLKEKKMIIKELD
ncbi:MAG: hypothetical protein HC854_14515 [Flavobacterium sp.]|nr:hypothetical protein [Flavobacterium sp.]